MLIELRHTHHVLKLWRKLLPTILCNVLILLRLFVQCPYPVSIVCPEDAKGLNRSNVCNPRLTKCKIQRAENFEVVILRGKLFRGLKKGAVHRSPPLKSPNDCRLLLKIDEIE